MSSASIRQLQQSILGNLVEAGKITKQQAETQPTSEYVQSVIPDIWRICKDDDAVAAAVAKHLSREVFIRAELGVTLSLGEDGEQWIIYGDTIYMSNPLDRRQSEKATTFARNTESGASKIGVISLSRIEQIKAIDRMSDDSVGADDQEIKSLQRIEDLVREAASCDASDIHLQPTQGEQVAIRFRVDGELITKRMYNMKLHDAMSRVIMENLCSQTLETGIPQDGKFDVSLSVNKKINIRVSSIPITRGSNKSLKFVLRLLGNNNTLASLDKLGMSTENLNMFRRFGADPNGLIVLTGPTGSGKTTTLNALLMDIHGRDPNKNYHTIEEPVEIQHEGMSHTECGRHLSFASALRSILRQDPDVILVGEMRDNETAELGFKASMTGHLVLSTLHTNNAHESIGRLEQMNIARDIITSNTTALAAQRLCRSLCPDCKVQYLLRTDKHQFDMYGNDPVFNGDHDVVIYRANTKGCSTCNPQGAAIGGLKGRRGIIEILEMTPGIQEAILAGVSPSVLRRSQIANGSFKDLWSDGLRLVKEGVVGIAQIEATLRPYLTDRVGNGSSSVQAHSGARIEHITRALHADAPVRSAVPQL